MTDIDEHPVSEPIIIETPVPPKRERLVVVPPDSCEPVREVGTGRLLGLSIRTEHARDATPEDLERAGDVAHLRADLRDMTARAERAEAERDAQIARADDAEASLARVLGTARICGADRTTVIHALRRLDP